MIKKLTPRIIIIWLIALVSISGSSAFAAANTVPTTRIGEQINVVTANSLKPAQCSSLNLTQVVICTGGKCNGSNADELILGTAGYDDISGKNGDDCIVGGGGDDNIDGDNGIDVCIGGPGDDDLGNKCETPIP